MIHIGLDVMGGDFAPLEAIFGVRSFISSFKEQDYVLHLIGEESALALLKEHHLDNHEKINFHVAGESVSYLSSPSRALKERPHSSIAIGYEMLEKNKINGFISAGNTGAMLVGAQTILRPIKNISRLAIGAIVPHPTSPIIILDVGSNIDCKPEHLYQFAILGTVYIKALYNIPHPTVALLNIGEEKNKGTTTYVEAHRLLSDNHSINFIGNIEGRDLLSKKSNIIVCDGFVGNVVIKLLESIYDQFKHVLDEKETSPSNSSIQIFNFEDHGGVPILGISKPVIVGHGISNARAFHKMLESAYELTVSKFCQKLEDSF